MILAAVEEDNWDSTQLSLPQQTQSHPPGLYLGSCTKS